MAEEHKTKTNPSGSVQKCDQRHIHPPHEWQNEFGGYFNVYCPGNDGKPDEDSVEWDIDANRPAEIIPMESEFEKELGHLLNKHSAENESGTPDFILAMFLAAQLDLFNQTIKDRAAWRDESVELPALQQLRRDQKSVEKFAAYFRKLVEDGVIVIKEHLEYTDLYRELMNYSPSKEFVEASDGQVEAGLEEGIKLVEEQDVPLIIYNGGQRNEIGTARVKVTPGEVLAAGTITSVIPQFADPDTSYSLNEPKDDPLPPVSTDTTPELSHSAFQRYQKEGLSDNG